MGLRTCFKPLQKESRFSKTTARFEGITNVPLHINAVKYGRAKKSQAFKLHSTHCQLPLVVIFLESLQYKNQSPKTNNNMLKRSSGLAEL